MKVSIYSLLLGVLFFASPALGHAFAPTATAAVQVTDTSYLFMFDLNLGYEQYHMLVPVFGSSFELESTDPSVQVADAAVITLGDTRAHNGTYHVEKGDGASFTILAVVTLEEALADDGAVRLQVTDVPFTLVDTADDTQWQNGLSAGELSSFVARTADVE